MVKTVSQEHGSWGVLCFWVQSLKPDDFSENPVLMWITQALWPFRKLYLPLGICECVREKAVQWEDRAEFCDLDKHALCPALCCSRKAFPAALEQFSCAPSPPSSTLRAVSAPQPHQHSHPGLASQPRHGVGCSESRMMEVCSECSRDRGMRVGKWVCSFRKRRDFPAKLRHLLRKGGNWRAVTGSFYPLKWFARARHLFPLAVLKAVCML